MGELAFLGKLITPANIAVVALLFVVILQHKDKMKMTDATIDLSGKVGELTGVVSGLADTLNLHIATRA